MLALLAYANSFHAGFVFDNRHILLEDERLQAVSLDNLQSILTTEYWWPQQGQGLYRPFTTLTYWLNYSVLGNADHPLGYHVVNALLHLINTLLVYALARRLTSSRTESHRLACFAAGLFAVHCLATEAVTNIVGRADLLAALSVLGGLMVYIRSAEKTGSPRAHGLIGLAVLAALGLFSKKTRWCCPPF